MSDPTIATPLPPEPAHDLPPGWLQVTSMDMDAQGVARKPDGQVVFIDGALPPELVSANTHRKKNNWEQASLTEIHRESSQRVRPGCPHFGLHAGACGGCKMQHLEASAQVAMKQRVLEDNLWHLGKVKAGTILRPIEGPSWGYRYRARLSVRYVAKKGAVLVGFHERKSRYIADMQTCKILPPHVDAMLMPLRALIGSLQARDTCPQIELACGDQVTALVLRHLEPLSSDDKQRLRDFAAEHGVVNFLSYSAALEAGQFQPSASSATARRRCFSPEPPIMIGMGFWTGFAKESAPADGRNRGCQNSN